MSATNDVTAPKRAARNVLARQREAQVLELRLSGATFDQIAQVIGYKGPSSARDAFDRALMRIVQEPAEKMRALELQRLDVMLLAIWQNVRRGDYLAIDRALKIMDRRAKLMGLDAPLKIDYRRMVRNTAAELGLTTDEAKELDRDVTRFLDEVYGQRTIDHGLG